MAERHLFVQREVDAIVADRLSKLKYRYERDLAAMRKRAEKAEAERDALQGILERQLK